MTPHHLQAMASPGNRYDKPALSYRGGAVLRAISIGLAAQETRPLFGDAEIF
ncbi:hypothetical protein [Arthrobacter sp. efr-133-TYG-104]|uniref:hypothetical protein n=1 Tax=Arthrobacter sp. efr-133-TYG-104 TaxID=3040324 RepID=UPI00254C71F2|nr:hypothetical protein [Arthrobacter sp. efr-133-TYG-104]